MSIFGERRRRGGDNRGEQKGYEYYEDTHNVASYTQSDYNVNSSARNYKPPVENVPKNLPNASEAITPPNYQNVIVYKPTTPDDVQTLIDFLKRREPAIVNLDDVEETSAQRVLDFVSGAIYALNGSIHRISGNIFLLSPEGIEVAVTYEDR